MSTKRSKARRAVAHAQRIALVRDNPFMCKATMAAHNIRLESMGRTSRSTCADGGLNAYRSNMLGMVQANSARRIKHRYGAMLPLARIATGSQHDNRVQLAISTTNKQLLIMADSIPLHEAIEAALCAPVDGWSIAIWRYAYHANRYQWLKSDSARSNTRRALLQAIADIKRLDSNAVDIITSLSLAFAKAKRDG